jgi:hypothetical protein
MPESDVEARIDAFLAKYDPAIEARLREARRGLRVAFPRGFELVFDNYNALVFGISPSERTSQAFISIAGYPKWVTLFFLNGASLDDPDGLLEGDGKQVRGIRLAHPDRLQTPAIASLVAQAAAPYAAALEAAPALTTVVKLVSAKQRPRRPPVPKVATGR